MPPITPDSGEPKHPYDEHLGYATLGVALLAVLADSGAAFALAAGVHFVFVVRRVKHHRITVPFPVYFMLFLGLVTLVQSLPMPGIFVRILSPAAMAQWAATTPPFLGRRLFYTVSLAWPETVSWAVSYLGFAAWFMSVYLLTLATRHMRLVFWVFPAGIAVCLAAMIGYAAVVPATAPGSWPRIVQWFEPAVFLPTPSAQAAFFGMAGFVCLGMATTRRKKTGKYFFAGVALAPLGVVTSGYLPALYAIGAALACYAVLRLLSDRVAPNLAMALFLLLATILASALISSPEVFAMSGSLVMPEMHVLSALWQSTFEAGMRYWVLGAGAGSFFWTLGPQLSVAVSPAAADIIHIRHAPSEYVKAVGEMGLPTTVTLVLGMIVFLWIMLHRAEGHQSRQGTAAAIIYLALLGLFAGDAFAPGVMVPLLAALAVMFQNSSKPSSTGRDPPIYVQFRVRHGIATVFGGALALVSAGALLAGFTLGQPLPPPEPGQKLTPEWAGQWQTAYRMHPLAPPLYEHLTSVVWQEGAASINLRYAVSRWVRTAPASVPAWLADAKLNLLDRDNQLVYTSFVSALAVARQAEAAEVVRTIRANVPDARAMIYRLTLGQPRVSARLLNALDPMEWQFALALAAMAAEKHPRDPQVLPAASPFLLTNAPAKVRAAHVARLEAAMNYHGGNGVVRAWHDASQGRWAKAVSTVREMVRYDFVDPTMVRLLGLASVPLSEPEMFEAARRLAKFYDDGVTLGALPVFRAMAERSPTAAEFAWPLPEPVPATVPLVAMPQTAQVVPATAAAVAAP